jgi:hypothetical protein
MDRIDDFIFEGDYMDLDSDLYGDDVTGMSDAQLYNQLVDKMELMGYDTEFMGGFIKRMFAKIKARIRARRARKAAAAAEEMPPEAPPEAPPLQIITPRGKMTLGPQEISLTRPAPPALPAMPAGIAGMLKNPMVLIGIAGLVLIMVMRKR